MSPSIDGRLLPWANRCAFSAWNMLAGRRLMILIFHRVPQVPDPLVPDEIDADRFDELMRMVSRSFRTMTFGSALHHFHRGTLPPRALVLTFDDGYADNAEHALPILRRHGLAATFFVSSGFLDGGLMWNDVVIESLRSTRLERADFGELGLGVLPLQSIEERRCAMASLLPLIKYQDAAGRRHHLQRLHAVLGQPVLPDRLMMTRQQVQQLHLEGMEIGAHTVSHPILTTLTLAQARTEILEGRRALQSVIDAPVDVMAYPNGQPDKDYSAEHVELLRDAGFRGAVTTATGVASSAADPFQLPRVSPWDRSRLRWSIRLFRNQLTTQHATLSEPERAL